MDLSTKITLLELRLHRLTAREQENAGVCRKIRRELRNLQPSAGTQSENPSADTESGRECL